MPPASRRRPRHVRLCQLKRERSCSIARATDSFELVPEAGARAVTGNSTRSAAAPARASHDWRRQLELERLARRKLAHGCVRQRARRVARGLPAARFLPRPVRRASRTVSRGSRASAAPSRARPGLGALLVGLENRLPRRLPLRRCSESCSASSWLFCAAWRRCSLAADRRERPRPRVRASTSLALQLQAQRDFCNSKRSASERRASRSQSESASVRPTASRFRAWSHCARARGSDRACERDAGVGWIGGAEAAAVTAGAPARRSHLRRPRAARRPARWRCEQRALERARSKLRSKRGRWPARPSCRRHRRTAHRAAPRSRGCEGAPRHPLNSSDPFVHDAPGRPAEVRECTRKRRPLSPRIVTAPTPRLGPAASSTAIACAPIARACRSFQPLRGVPGQGFFVK